MTKTALLTLSLLLAGSASADAKQLSYKERLRAEAEHACYQDAKRLCDSDIPNEAKVEACMGRHRAELSPACAAVFEKGI